MQIENSGNDKSKKIWKTVGVAAVLTVLIGNALRLIIGLAMGIASGEFDRQAEQSREEQAQKEQEAQEQAEWEAESLWEAVSDQYDKEKVGRILSDVDECMAVQDYEGAWRYLQAGQVIFPGSKDLEQKEEECLQLFPENSALQEEQEEVMDIASEAGEAIPAED